MNGQGNDDLANEILKPILYGDIFDYPLTFEEIYQFLEVRITQEDARKLLHQALEDRVIGLIDGYYSLVTRSNLAAKRRERQKLSRLLWPKAIRYGRWIAGLPFVRFVAVTGSLAVENPREGAEDIDYLIVTRSRRLWLCRAMTILLVKYGRRRGVRLCPNYLITENVLAFDDSLFAAREMLQMKPLYGRDLYLKMRSINAWVTGYFPHGRGFNLDRLDDVLPGGQRFLKKLGEFVLGGLLGNVLEKWMQRTQMTKHLRLARQADLIDSVIFAPDICKGHYEGHNHRTMDAYQQRMLNYADGRSPRQAGKAHDLATISGD